MFLNQHYIHVCTFALCKSEDVPNQYHGCTNILLNATYVHITSATLQMYVCAIGTPQIQIYTL